MAARIRKDDIVVVVAGDHKGSRGKVLRVLPEKDRVVVEGVNMVYRHLRRSRQNPQGGRVQKEAPIHLSNVMPLDPRTDKAARVRFTQTRGSDGQPVKQRVTAGRRASGAVLSEVKHQARGERKGTKS
ncbi:MAG: 50S ribosomal protein L24 [Phycisphaerales bacterium]|nr:50S ribosomal protein L24 [Phycisphaerales bacterium]